jgi:hypothetical protein
MRIYSVSGHNHSRKMQAGMAGRRMDGEWTAAGRQHSHVHRSFYLLPTLFLSTFWTQLPFSPIMRNQGPKDAGSWAKQPAGQIN